MKLNLLERVTILGILPKEANFLNLKIIKDIQDAVSFTEDDFKEFDIKQEGVKITWNVKGDEEREVSIGEKATDIIVEALKELNKNKKLTANHYSLYVKFVGE